MKIAIVVCMHGNEQIGLKIKDSLQYKYKNKDIDFITANQKAIDNNTRFIDSDLNRVFPGKINSTNHEENLAYKLTKQLKLYNYIIDIHSTTADMRDTIITTNKEQETLTLANRCPIKTILHMTPNIAKKNSLIENIKTGISIEFGTKTTKEEATQVIEETIKNLIKNTEHAEEKEIYDVYDKETNTANQKETLIENFKKIKIHNEEFYPVFFGEVAYKNILYLKAKKNKVS